LEFIEDREGEVILGDLSHTKKNNVAYGFYRTFSFMQMKNMRIYSMNKRESSLDFLSIFSMLSFHAEISPLFARISRE
jgi:hypothetical protein